MNRSARLGRREERNTHAWGPSEGEHISKSPLIFLSMIKCWTNKVCHKSKQIWDIIRVAAAALITFQGALLYVEHFGEFLIIPSQEFLEDRSAPNSGMWKLQRCQMPAQGHTSSKHDSAGVPLPYFAFKERAQINWATKPNKKHRNDFRGLSFKLLSTTHKRLKWNVGSTICQFWTRVTTIKFHPGKSNIPGGLEYIFTSEVGMCLNCNIPPVGKCAEGSPPPTARVYMALSVLIYYTLDLSNTWLLERKIRDLEMFIVRKDGNMTCPHSRDQQQATMNTWQPTQGVPFPELPVLTVDCARMLTLLGCAT